jgi:hypothetical protein
MAEKTFLTDPDAMLMETVEPAEGYSVEDAYRVLMDKPIAPVVEPEE